MELSVRVAGMHCDSCIGKVTEALQNLAGVQSVHVSLKPPVAHVIARSPIGLTEIDAALRRAGLYHAEEVIPDTQVAAAPAEEGDQGTFYPLVLIFAYLAGTVLVIAWTSKAFSAHALMSWFMGGFFLVFSFFKLLDLRGFAMAYRSYDVVARALPAWGFVYPFVELALGGAYLTAWQPFAINVVTLVVMLVSAVGVLQSLIQKRAIRCACLGTVLNLPMTQVTLIEDLGMAAMAAFMLLRFV